MGAAVETPKPPMLSQELSLLLRRDVSIDEAERVLDTLSADQLTDLDGIGRGVNFHTDWDSRSARAEIATMDSDGERFLAACARNGFLRERGLREITERPGRLALTAALLRAGDWVPQVRNVALAALQRLIPGNEAMLWQRLELVLTLRGQQRFHEQAWSMLILPVLVRVDQAEHRWACAIGGRARERLFAWDLVAEHDPARTPAACLQAVQDPHAGLASWAIDHAMHLHTNDALPVLLRALDHRQPRVRAAALRAYAARETDIESHAQRLLLDRAAGPRNAAEFLLRTRYGVDAIAVWRDAMDRGQAPQAAYAADALCERAQPEDIDRFVRLLDHRTVAMRAAALRGLARANAHVFDTMLPKALADDAPKVVRQALVLGRRRGLSMALLRTARAEHTNPAARRSLVLAARSTGKWQCIELLLEWLGDSPLDEVAGLLAAISAWHDQVNRSFVPLPAEGKTRILANAATAGGRLPTRQRLAIESVARDT